MKRYCILFVCFLLCLLAVGCQASAPGNGAADESTPIITDSEGSSTYITFDSVEDFVQSVHEAEAELEVKGARSTSLSAEATRVAANKIGDRKAIYVPIALHERYGIESVDMGEHIIGYVFPNAEPGQGVTFNWFLSLDPLLFPIEDWFPQGSPKESWTFESSGINYFVAVYPALADNTVNLLSVYFVVADQLFHANLPYGLTNDEIASLLKVVDIEATSLKD